MALEKLCDSIITDNYIVAKIARHIITLGFFIKTISVLYKDEVFKFRAISSKFEFFVTMRVL